MIPSLISRLYKERLYSLLPINSSHKTYKDVENDKYYLAFRTIIVNVAMSRGLNAIIEQTLDAVDKILNGEPNIVSDNITNEMIQSILVLIRLLNGILEYYWDEIDNFAKDNKYDSDYSVLMDSNIASTKPMKPIRLKQYPNLIKDSLVIKLLDTCIKIKFHIRTLHILANISNYLTHTSNSIPFNTILPDYQKALKDKEIYKLAEIMDYNVCQISRFLSASNPNCFFRYIYDNIQKKIFVSPNELCVVPYLHFLSQVFLVKSIAFQYLEFSKYILGLLNKPVFQHIIMFYVSKVYIFWIMSRPEEYVSLIKEYKVFLKKHQSKSNSLNAFITNFFDEIYSKYSVSSILTNTQNVTSKDSNKINPETMTNNNNDNDNDNNNENDIIYYFPYPTTSIFNSSTIHSNLHALNISHDFKNDQGNSSNLSNFSFPFVNASSNINISDNIEYINQSSSPPVYDQFRNADDFFNNSNSPYTLKNSKRRGANFENVNDLYLKLKAGNLTSRIHKISSSQNTTHLSGILILFSYFDDNDPLTHIAPLRFLMILTLFDVEVYHLMNIQSFRNLLNTGTVNSKQERFFDNTLFHLDSRSPNQSLEQNGKQGDKQKKGFNHSFKKLSLLSFTKKRSFKFLSLLIKNLNESLVTSSTVALDAIRVTLMYLLLASSISMVNKGFEIVTLARRMIPILGINLGVGENWGKNLISNKILVRWLSKNQPKLNQFKITYIISVLRFKSTYFMKNLGLLTLNSDADLEKLDLYIESIKLFFILPTKQDVMKTVVNQISSFLKDSLCSITNIILTDHPTLDKKVTSFVDFIIDKIIREQVDNMNSFSNSDTLSIVSSVKENSLLGDIGSPTGSLVSHLRQHSVHTDSNVDLMSQMSFLSTSSSSNLSLMSSLARDQSRSNNNLETLVSHNNGNCETSFLIAPQASALSSNKNHSSLFISQEDKNSTSVSVTSHSTLHASSTTPLSKQFELYDSLLMKDTAEPNNSLIRRVISKISIDSSIKSISSSKGDGNYAKNILFNILTIFDKYLPLFILPCQDLTNSIWVLNDFRNVIQPIFISIILFNQQIQAISESVLNSLIFNVESMMDKVSSIAIKGYILICNCTICLFSMSLFDFDINDAKRNVLIVIIIKNLKLRKQLLNVAKERDIFDQVSNSEKAIFPLLVGTLGCGLLLSLSSSNSDVYNGLRIICQELDTAISFHNKYVDNISPNIFSSSSFQEILGQCDDLTANTGSVFFQRKIRKGLLKHVKSLDLVLLDSMCILFKKWKKYSRIGKKLDTSEWTEFRNLSGILASLSGLLFLGYKKIEVVDDSQFENLVVNLRKDFNFFIYKQCQWLNDSDLIMRENAKDVISIELNPFSYNILFAHLNARIEELFTSQMVLSNNKDAFILLEQIIVIIRTIMRKEDEEEVMILFSMDILGIVDKLPIVVSMIPYDSPQYYKAIIQLSKMFKALESSETSMAIKNHFRLKNKWLKHLIEWFKLAISKEYDIENLSKLHRDMDLVRRDLDYLYIDTVIESSKAIAYLTKNLPLEVVSASTEDEMKRSIFVKFGNYFNILLKGLRKTMDHEKYPLSLRHKIDIVNENVIWALTNLSRANIESSWKFTLPMGYSSDKSIRIAFLKLFTNIVSSMQIQQKEIENEKLEAVDNFLQFIIENPQLGYAVAHTCPSKDLDAYTTVLINGLKMRNAAHIVVCQLITEEIAHALRPMDILRRNSCATRALSLFAKDKGSKYLIDILQPILKEYVDSKEYFEVERLIPSEPNYEKQISLFVKYMKMIIDAVTQSAVRFPPEFFYICHTIYTEVDKKFPDYAYIAVGSFVFLRFICPALVNPEAENIIELSSISESRPLITLAKIIQNIANGSDNVIKWPSLISQSGFLSECSVKIFNFLKEICAPERVPTIKIKNDCPLKPFEYSFLHHLLITRSLEIRKKLLEGLNYADELPFFRKTFFLIDDLLGKLGEPKVILSQEIPEFFTSNSEKYPMLYEYMYRQTFRSHGNLNKALAAISESITSNGMPIISLNINRNVMQDIDHETLIYQLLKVYVRIWNTPHFFAIDFTDFDSSYFDIKKMIKLLSTLLPSFTVSNCQGFYLLNINENFIHCWDVFFNHENIYLKKAVPVHFINSALDGYVLESLNIEGNSVDVLQDIRVSLHDIELQDLTKNISIPVSLKIGNKYFQILFEDTRDMVIKQFDEFISVKVNEVRELINISSVSVSTVVNSKMEFTIKMNDCETFVFISSKYLEIIKIFQYAIAREETSMLRGPSTIIKSQLDELNNELNLNTEYNDIICNLILAMVVSLFHPDNTVKSLSYNFFGEANKIFNLGFNTAFHNTPELYIPSNITSFLNMLAKAQARKYPSLTVNIWKYSLKAIKHHDISKDYIPTALYALSKWVQNLMDYVYLVNRQEGPNIIAQIFRDLIKLSVEDDDFATIYLREIWFPICADGRLSDILVDEVINHALERDSENCSWSKIIPIICSFPTVEISREIVKKLLTSIRTVLSSFQMKGSNQSWAELKILVSIATYSFFETSFVTKMFLPELLFSISLLMDVGPTDMRLLICKLLMNVCSSLVIDTSLASIQKEQLELLILKFSNNKIKYISGFSQHKDKLQLILNVSSFSSKFNILKDFIEDIFGIMRIFPGEDHIEWIVRYRKLLNDIIFSSSSFFSSRATMITGIILRKQPSETFCRDLIVETIKVVSSPIITDENMFIIMSHCFTFNITIDGLDPSSYLIKRLFWFSVTLINIYDTAVYEGALLLLSKTFNKVSAYCQNDNEKYTTSIDILLESRKFASNIFKQIDEIDNTVWNQENFAHILASIISSGYSVLSIRHISVDCLQTTFMNLFLEEDQHNISTNYRCFMFILFLLIDNEKFINILQKVGYNKEIMVLSKDYRIPADLLCWLASDSASSNTSLYQGSLIFNNKTTDEQIRFKFSLIMKYLLVTNSVCLFRIYGNVEERIKKMIVIDGVSESIPLLLDIVGQAVRFNDFDNITQYKTESLKRIERQGLRIIIDLCNEHLHNKKSGDIDKLITRRVLVVRILECLICL